MSATTRRNPTRRRGAQRRTVERMADHLTAGITDRLRQRPRDESGSIGVVAMGIGFLLMATSLAMFSAAANQAFTARTSQEFTYSEQGINDAHARALRAFNNGAFNPLASTSPSAVVRDWNYAGQSAASASLGRLRWSYAYPARTVTALSTQDAYDTTGRTETLPMRWMAVGSRDADPETGALVYGAAPNDSHAYPGNSGLWNFGLTAGADSVVGASQFQSMLTTGVLRPDYDVALLDGAMSLNRTPAATASPLRVTQFGDGRDTDTIGGPSVSGTGWSGKPYRSKVTLQYDLQRLRARTVGDVFDPNSPNTCLNRPPTAGTLIAGALYCSMGNTTLPAVTAPSGAQPATIVVRGNLTIPADISGGLTTSTSRQIHIYVTGNVNFTKPTPSSTSRHKMTNAFIYAPLGKCSNATGAPLDFSGAMACKSLDLPSKTSGLAAGNTNTFTYVMPRADTPTHPGATAVGLGSRIFYTESADYVDHFTP